jgi:predicted DNA binding CopG/RHH family protein
MGSVPRLRTDEEADAFLDQDLTDLDFGQFRAGQLGYERKDARLTMRLPQAMQDAVKRHARARVIPYQWLVREAIEKALVGAGANCSYEVANQ